MTRWREALESGLGVEKCWKEDERTRGHKTGWFGSSHPVSGVAGHPKPPWIPPVCNCWRIISHAPIPKHTLKFADGDPWQQRSRVACRWLVACPPLNRRLVVHELTAWPCSCMMLYGLHQHPSTLSGLCEFPCMVYIGAILMFL